MRKSTPVARISASACGRMRSGSTGGATAIDLVGQALALRRVEDGEALEERDRLRFVAGLRGAPAFVLRREAVGIDDGRAALALADMATEARAPGERSASSGP